MADKSEWLTSKDLAEFLAKRRENDIRVSIHNIGVPIIDIYYDSADDVIEIFLDEDSEDYRTALSP